MEKLKLQKFTMKANAEDAVEFDAWVYGNYFADDIPEMLELIFNETFNYTLENDDILSSSHYKVEVSETPYTATIEVISYNR